MHAQVLRISQCIDGHMYVIMLSPLWCGMAMQCIDGHMYVIVLSPLWCGMAMASLLGQDEIPLQCSISNNTFSIDCYNETIYRP